MIAKTKEYCLTQTLQQPHRSYREVFRKLLPLFVILAAVFVPTDRIFGFLSMTASWTHWLIYLAFPFSFITRLRKTAALFYRFASRVFVAYLISIPLVVFVLPNRLAQSFSPLGILVTLFENFMLNMKDIVENFSFELMMVFLLNITIHGLSAGLTYIYSIYLEEEIDSPKPETPPRPKYPPGVRITIGFAVVALVGLSYLSYKYAFERVRGTSVSTQQAIKQCSTAYEESGLSGLLSLSKKYYESHDRQKNIESLKLSVLVDFIAAAIDSRAATAGGFPTNTYFSIESIRNRSIPRFKKLGISEDKAALYLRNWSEEIDAVLRL